MVNQFLITDFGAVGDGQTDCTESIQKALDAAGKNEFGGEVIVPPGVYLTGELRIPAHVKFSGAHAWSIQHSGGSILRLNDDKATCMLNITKAIGSTISGLSLVADREGKDIHGIAFLREDFFDHPEEDTLRIENCHIRRFSGSGIYLQFACAFSVRHCQIYENGGDGMHLNSWDAFIVDNWFSSNEGWGVRCDDYGINTSAMMFTANRVEWNKKGGFFLRHAKLWQIVGNSFDRQGGPAIHIAEGIPPSPELDPRWVKIPCHAITITGNVFSRNAANFKGDLEDYDLCHIRMHECFGVTVTGNTMLVGLSDNVLEGEQSPKYGIVVDRLKGCVITANTMYNGYTAKDILDLGGHGEQVIIDKNPSAGVSSTDSKKVFTE